MHTTRTLVLPDTIVAEIIAIVSEAPAGKETGVSLFGVPISGIANRYVVLAVCGPGPHATHEPDRYSSDTDFTSSVFSALTQALPSMSWIGELHVHPRGMTWLSREDRETVTKLLTETDPDTYCPRAFIAGVLQGRKDGVALYPYYFDRKCLEGVSIEIERVDSDADVVRQARYLASRTAAQDLLKPAPTQNSSREKKPPRWRWLRKINSILRRRRTEREAAFSTTHTAAGQAVDASALTPAGLPEITPDPFLHEEYTPE